MTFASLIILPVALQYKGHVGGLSVCLSLFVCVCVIVCWEIDVWKGEVCNILT